MGFNFHIGSKAAFDTCDAEALRERLFGKPRPSLGLRPTALFDDRSAAPSPSYPAKSIRRTPKKSVRLRKAGASANQPPAQQQVCDMPRRRLPVEYLGHMITNEQQPDGKWVASFVRIDGAKESVRRSAPYPASYMAFADAKAQIDTALSAPSVTQREFPRIPVALDGMIFAANGAYECQLIDLSAGGARLRPTSAIALEGELILFIQGFGRYPAVVTQGGDKEISVRFVVDGETVLSLLKGLSNYMKGFDTPHIKVRKETRVAAPITAVCRDAKGTAISCEIINASMRSMSIAMTQRPQIGTLVMLGRTKVRVMRHHESGIAVQCLPVPTVRSSRYVFSEVCACDAAAM